MVPRTRVDEAFGLSPGQHPTLADSRPPRSQKIFPVSTSSLQAPRSPLTRASALVARRYLGGARKWKSGNFPIFPEFFGFFDVNASCHLLFRRPRRGGEVGARSQKRTREKGR